jgi:hypothetical protein
MGETDERPRSSVDGIAILAVFLMVVAFTYNDEVVEMAHAGAGGYVAYSRWIVLLVDCAIVLCAAGLKWRMEARENPSGTMSWQKFLPRLLHSPWPSGVALMVALHIVMVFLPFNLAVDITVSMLFTVSMSLVLVAALDVGTLGADRSRHRDWILPVLLGTLVVQVAAALWFPVLDVEGNCAGTVSTDFFSQMVQVIPMLLVTLGIELGVLRRSSPLRTPGQRAAPILTVVMLCVAEILSFSMLVASDRTACGVAATMHEFAAFVLSVQATSIALVTLVWLLMTDSR